jgi:hypothetical protein
VPRAFVFFEAHLFGFAVRVEAEHGRGNAGFDGKHVPDVERDDVGDEEVDVAGRVNGAAFADGVGGPSFVSVRTETVGGLDLDAKQAAAVVENEVVALGVAPGLGNAEAEGAGFVEEGGFGAFSGAFGIFWDEVTLWVSLGCSQGSVIRKVKSPISDAPKAKRQGWGIFGCE